MTRSGTSTSHFRAIIGTAGAPAGLGADLHHDPTRGGAAEQNRFAAQYAETLASYERYFGPPSPTFWPGTAERFRARPRYRVVDCDRAIVLPVGFGLKPLLRRWAALLGLSSLLALLTPTSAAALPANPLDWTAEPFLTLYVVTIVAGVALALGVRSVLRVSDRRPRQDGLGEIDLAYLAGGPTRAADTVILGFMLAGGARLEGTGGEIVFAEQASRLPHHLTPFGGYASGAMPRADLIKRMDARLEAIRHDLIERGLLLTREQAGRSIAAVVGIMGLVAGFGGLKIAVGLSRGKPVGFLVVLVFVAVIAGIVLCLEAVRRTRAGTEALADYRARHERAARAPRDREIPLAFALTGPAVLAGTAYAAYGDLLKASGSGGDGGGGDGGGGGGGCGGCGGGD